MLKQWVLPVGVSVIVGLLVGCDAKTPNCSSDETQKLVQEITLRELFKAYPKIPQAQRDSIQVSLAAIRTQSHDTERDSYSCAADLTVLRQDLGKNSSFPITYTVQKVDNEQQFYVQVYGL